MPFRPHVRQLAGDAWFGSQGPVGSLMNNSQIADIFEEMADLLEISGENAFRVRAYRNGAKAIQDLAEEVADILKDPSRKLTDIDGIGETLAEKCETMVQSGALPALEKLRAKVPRTLRVVMKVPGVGPKKAATLWKELGVIDLLTLREAAEERKIEELKGFGAKTQEGILHAISIVEQASQRLLIHQADALAHRIREHMAKEPSIERLECAGSYRRGKRRSATWTYWWSVAMCSEQWINSNRFLNVSRHWCVVTRR